MKKANYYKEAAKETLNILILLAITISAVLGFQNIAIGGLIFELIYLITIPNIQSYKNFINLKKGYKEAGDRISERQELIRSLPQNVRPKAEKLIEKYESIKQKADKNPDLKMMMSDEIEKMEYLLNNYLKFSENLSGYKEYLLNNNEDLIRQETDNLRHRVHSCYDNLKTQNDLDMIHKRMQKKTLLLNNMEILNKRLEKVRHLKGLTETLQTELDVIEDTFYLIGDHIITFTPGSRLNLDLNGIVRGVENTEKVVSETYNEMDKLKNMNIQKILDH